MPASWLPSFLEPASWLLQLPGSSFLKASFLGVEKLGLTTDHGAQCDVSLVVHPSIYQKSLKITKNSLTCDLEAKGHMGQGQRSHGSRSKVTWVMVKLGPQTKTGELMTRSSCFVLPDFWGRSPAGLPADFHEFAQC